jgi:hypothetical protein
VVWGEERMSASKGLSGRSWGSRREDEEGRLMGGRRLGGWDPPTGGGDTRAGWGRGAMRRLGFGGEGRAALGGPRARKSARGGR